MEGLSFKRSRNYGAWDRFEQESTEMLKMLWNDISGLVLSESVWYDPRKENENYLRGSVMSATTAGMWLVNVVGWFIRTRTVNKFDRERGWTCRRAEGSAYYENKNRIIWSRLKVGSLVEVVVVGEELGNTSTKAEVMHFAGGLLQYTWHCFWKVRLLWFMKRLSRWIWPVRTDFVAIIP